MFHPRSSTIVACASRDDREEGHQKRVVESGFFELSNDLVDSFGEDTSSKEEEVERDDDRHLRRYAFECRPSRFDVNPVPEVIRDRRGQPNFPRFVERLVCPNGQEFETSCLRATHRQLFLSLLRFPDGFSNFLRSPRILNINVEIERNELSAKERFSYCTESGEDCHSQDGMGGKLLEIRFSTGRVTL